MRLWLLRMMLDLDGHKDWVQTHGFSSDALATELGLGHWLDEEARSFDPKAVRQELRQLHQQAETQAPHPHRCRPPCSATWRNWRRWRN